jgi:hypothetical protein
MLSAWADVSLMWLILLTLLMVIPIGVIFFFAVKGMHRLRQLAKLYLPIAQEKTRFVADKTEEISIQIANPFIAVNAKAAQVSGVTRAIFARRKHE